ncbi:uncharacterized protein PRCAT00002680001 [Priceomyces carsonii]|uniref:uncharacterized protein n=1 Tax=Priceomyces carsonii TaxID=28549 RepID=UPI002EDAD3AF|nr:unnamed protein product [Priceomyces carsonii]
MLKSFLRTVNSATRSSGGVLSPNPITIYHQTNSHASAQLLSKLHAYSMLPSTLNKYDQYLDVQTQPFKFQVNIKINKGLSYQDYLFIMNECLDIHPDNKQILQRLMKLNKSYDMNVLSRESFEKLLQGITLSEPLVIDYKNNLIANDEKTFDRIMANYLSCGIQHSYNVNNLNPTGRTTSSQMHEVHPHVAEFADLF